MVKWVDSDPSRSLRAAEDVIGSSEHLLRSRSPPIFLQFGEFGVQTRLVVLSSSREGPILKARNNLKLCEGFLGQLLRL